MSIDTLEAARAATALDRPAFGEAAPVRHAADPHTPDGPARALLRPALLAGEECEAPDPWIFRGTD
ncbi:hypothetical protein [Streptomyces sp. 351MFTsu5.1]|uniref:hypothetical protein n=1 Tax=Streptomyces sp. 351MFTsu5.1 TaxID=1172180 RepID=UPI00038033B6|nr:hypothetical protein [Streptomyces sp. 351MFTsu5.1]